MTKKKILVVDDEPNIVKVIVQRLKTNNYELITATDGESCINKFKSKKPDLIILDIMMPGMDGYDVLTEMREMVEVLKDLQIPPIIVITGRSEPDIKKFFKEEEIKNYIVKPFDAEDLLKKVKQILK